MCQKIEKSEIKSAIVNIKETNYKCVFTRITQRIEDSVRIPIKKGRKY